MKQRRRHPRGRKNPNGNGGSPGNVADVDVANLPEDIEEEEVEFVLSMPMAIRFRSPTARRPKSFARLTCGR